MILFSHYGKEIGIFLKLFFFKTIQLQKKHTDT